AGRALKDSDFLEHLALTCALAGRAAAVYVLDEMIQAKGLVFGLMALAEGAWFTLNPNFSFRLVSTCSAYAFLGGFLYDFSRGTGVWIPLLTAGALTLIVFVALPAKGRDPRDEIWRPLGWGSILALGVWSLGGGD